ncbi:lysosomal alpha-mannosidase isoform X2 [Tetranychus urticae]|nr:lysosomal alpha-mannosidase isoform X2 [Tetranychus urticae]XP_025017361.1 lysosomal alpha-mannosidase isoform X2 [Tetranychus urticae]XP_025017362.1 lysosomal alpha-mannosidase isoform X2 [Tetranychus urticae]
MDTGWVITYDEYYQKYVREIYNSVLSELRKARDRKFIAVETSFFSTWYNELNEPSQAQVKQLVADGQLEFISGGWSMNDEACPLYSGIINQMTLGHKWLNETFGECGVPRIGWQIDSFGHSREFASILSQMGYDGLFLGRVDYQDKEVRTNHRNLEFIWKSSPSIGKRSDLFTSILPNVYWPPKNFCFDYNCYDEPVTEYNAPRRAREFIDRVIRPYSKMYATNNTIITMGMDFYYRDAYKWYSNLDLLMQAVNNIGSREGIHMFYSTPSCYLKSLYDAQVTWPVKADDFFPYADAYNTYWTGYFSSRPTLKQFMRYSESLLAIAKQLNVLSLLGMEQSKLHAPLEQVLGILHHHDAITGTCKQRVADDYAKQLHEGIKRVEESIVASMNRILFPRGPLHSEPIHFCHLLNHSHCEVVQKMSSVSANNILVHVFNPLSTPVKHYIKLPVDRGLYEVFASDRSSVDHQLLHLADSVRSLPHRSVDTPYELLFRATLPALGYTTYLIRKINGPDFAPPRRLTGPAENSGEVVIENNKMALVFNPSTGLLQEIILSDGRRVPFKQNFHLYRGSSGSYTEKASGAYAFNPTSDGSSPATNKVTYHVSKGDLVEEVHQVFNEYISQTIRLHQHSDSIEFDWVIGPIPKGNWYSDLGREIVTRYETDFHTNGTWWTDSNGREAIRRTRDHRPTWNLITTENVAANYYPISTWTFIRDYDRNLQLTVLPDRAEGGASLTDGALELMVHRRLFYDDGFGMEEALDEPGSDAKGLIVKGRHHVILNDIRPSVQKIRTMSKQLALPPLTMFRALTDPGIYHLNRPERFDFSGLHRKLPINIHLLSLERWDDNKLLIRLEHFFEVNEDLKFSRPRRVSLRDIFDPLRITSAQEVTLNVVQDRRAAEKRRLRFVSRFDPYFNYTNLLSQIDPNDQSNHSDGQEPLIVILYPMDIKSYLVTFEAKRICFGSSYSARGQNRARSYPC